MFHLALADLLLASLWFSGACLWFHKQEGSCFYLDAFAEVSGLLNNKYNFFLWKKNIVKPLEAFFSRSSLTVEPLVTKGSGDWQNMFAIMRFLVSRFFSIYFTITGMKNVIHYTKDFII